MPPFQHAYMSLAATESDLDTPGGCQLLQRLRQSKLMQAQRMWSAMQANNLVRGVMNLPTEHAKLTKVRGTYKGLMGQVAARNSRFVTVRVPSTQLSAS